MKRALALLATAAVIGTGPAACAQSGQAAAQLTAAARACGFENPQFKLHDGVYELNETEWTGAPYGPLNAEQQRNWDRSRTVRSKWMPCLQDAAKRLGLRVTYEKMVIVN